MKYTSALRRIECEREHSINHVHACEICVGPFEIYGGGRNGS